MKRTILRRNNMIKEQIKYDKKTGAGVYLISNRPLSIEVAFQVGHAHDKIVKMKEALNKRRKTLVVETDKLEKSFLKQKEVFLSKKYSNKNDEYEEKQRLNAIEFSLIEDKEKLRETINKYNNIEEDNDRKWQTKYQVETEARRARTLAYSSYFGKDVTNIYGEYITYVATWLEPCVDMTHRKSHKDIIKGQWAFYKPYNMAACKSLPKWALNIKQEVARLL